MNNNIIILIYKFVERMNDRSLLVTAAMSRDFDD